MKKSLLALSLLIACGAANAAPASVVNGFDLSTFNFDVTSYSVGTGGGLNGNSTASGTSNGISWSISPTNIYSGYTTITGSYDFAALPNNTDRLHTSTDFTITFAQPVKTLIVALSNDNLTDSINFGISPSFIQGATFNSTSKQITLNNAAGGLAWFTDVNTLTFKNTNNNGITDGYDIAFHAIAAVPEPETYAMLLAGLGLMGTIARRRRQK